MGREAERTEADPSSLSSSQLVFDSRIQGGVLADGLAGLLSGLGTVTPMFVALISFQLLSPIALLLD